MRNVGTEVPGRMDVGGSASRTAISSSALGSSFLPDRLDLRDVADDLVGHRSPLCLTSREQQR